MSLVNFIIRLFTSPIHWCIISSEVMNMATDKQRYTVSVDDELFQQIEDFRFEHRFQTRSEATVELIRMGLELLKREQEEAKKAE